MNSDNKKISPSEIYETLKILDPSDESNLLRDYFIQSLVELNGLTIENLKLKDLLRKNNLWPIARNGME